MRSPRLILLLILTMAAAAPVAAAQDAGSAGDLGQLLSLEDRKTFDAGILQRATQHPDSLVRRYAAMVMGRIGDAAAVPLLRTLLTDRDTLVRIETAFAFGSVGDRSIVPELAHYVETFGQVTGDFECEVVTALARIGGPDAERAIGGLLDRHPASGTQTDRATATALIEAWRFGRNSSIARRLPEYIRTAKDVWRRNATYSAGRMRLAIAAPVMLDAANDPDPYTRAYAARAMTASTADSGGIPRDAFLSRLRNLVADEDPQVRTNAIGALATYEDSALVAIAASHFTDRDPNVPIQAAVTLGRLGGSRAAAALVERFNGATSYGLRRAILLGLAACAPAAAIETARPWRNDSDWRLRAGYVEVLGATRSPAAKSELVALLADPEPRVVAAALGALARAVPADDSALFAAARSRLTSSDAGLRASAASILGRSRTDATVTDLVAAYRLALNDQTGDARLSIVDALADIADSLPALRPRIVSALLDGMPRSNDYLVRRAVHQRFGEAAMRATWGEVGPIETGRTSDEYRDIARRYILGFAPPGPVTIEGERGTVVVSFYPFDAPLTVDNFLRLVNRRFFDNGRWHRVVPNFVVQDGAGNGTGSGVAIRDEINRRRYDRGTMGMALSGPDTGTSQFFITHSPQPHLDGGYTVFGQVVSGWDILDQIVQGDRIRRIYRQ